MKKLKFTLLISAMVFSGALIYLTSCQKQQENQIQNNPIDEQSREVVQHILDFKAEMEYYRENPGLKSDYKKEIMQTILDWESNVNMQFCYSYLELADIAVFDTVLEIPLVGPDSIFMSEVSDRYYNHIVLAVQQHYFDAPYSMKKLMVVDLEPMADPDSLHIRTFVGNTNFMLHPQYDWKYGNSLGDCSGNYFVFETDAAIELSQDIREYFYEEPPHGYHWSFLNIDTITANVLDENINGQYIYLNPNDDIPDNNDRDFLIYYANSNNEDDGIIPPEVEFLEFSGDYQFYKQNYIALTNDWIIGSNGKKFMECYYVGYDITDNDTELFHHLETTIATRIKVAFVVPTDDIETY